MVQKSPQELLEDKAAVLARKFADEFLAATRGVLGSARGDLFAPLAESASDTFDRLTPLLFDTSVAGGLLGAAEMLRPLSGDGRGGFPTDPKSIIYPPGEGPVVDFPIVRKSIKAIEAAVTLSPESYYALSAAAKRQAFTVTANLKDSTIEKIRDVLRENVAERQNRAKFEKAIREQLPEVLSDAHIEQVFRNNVNAAYSDGAETALRDPFVVDAFPFRAYYSIHDDRARPEHRRLEKLGLNGTNVFAANDPVWTMFRPPWDFNSVVTGELVTTSTGQVPIEKVQKGDVVLTHRGRWRPVVGSRTSKGPSEIVVVHTDCGGTIRLTGEHRVWTEHGWIEASSLHVGQQVYQVANPALLNLMQLKVKNTPQPQRLADGLVPCVVRVSPSVLNLNANFQRWEMEVKPIGWGGFVEREFKSGVSKSIGSNFFPATHGGLEVDVRGRVEQVVSLASGNHSGSNFGAVRGLNHPVSVPYFPGARGVSLVAQQQGFSSVAYRDMVLQENAFQGAVVNPTFGTDACDGRLAGRVGGNSSRQSSSPGSQLGFGFCRVRGDSAGLLTDEHDVSLRSVKVTKIQRQLYCGNVHDISVAEDESFVAGGVAVANCRCGFTPLTIRQAARKGVLVAAEWLETGKQPVNLFVPWPDFLPSPSWRRL